MRLIGITKTGRKIVPLRKIHLKVLILISIRATMHVLQAVNALTIRGRAIPLHAF